MKLKEKEVSWMNSAKLRIWRRLPEVDFVDRPDGASGFPRPHGEIAKGIKPIGISDANV